MLFRRRHGLKSICTPTNLIFLVLEEPDLWIKTVRPKRRRKRHVDVDDRQRSWIQKSSMNPSLKLARLSSASTSKSSTTTKSRSPPARRSRAEEVVLSSSHRGTAQCISYDPREPSSFRKLFPRLLCFCTSPPAYDLVQTARILTPEPRTSQRCGG